MAKYTIGLDYASDGLYVDDRGKVGTNHKYYCESQKKLAKEQRKLSGKIGSKKVERKSNNYIKTCLGMKTPNQVVAMYQAVMF